MYSDSLIPDGIRHRAPDADRRDSTDLLDWLAARRVAADLVCEPVPLDELRAWDVASGALAHRTGRYFTVVPARTASTVEGMDGSCQLFIHQPEVGLLGFLVRPDADGPRLLVQAKAEPGNVGDVQIAPSVQATVSNYERVHGGRATPFLDRFSPSGTATLVADSLQSEQGTRFLGKYNRNATAVTTHDEQEPPDGWRWVPASRVLALLGEDFVVNTDARSVLVCSDWNVLAGPAGPFGRWIGAGGTFGGDLRESFHRVDAAAIRHAERVLRRMRRSVRLSVEPIAWGESELGGGAVHLSPSVGVVGVRVRVHGREVDAWDQPLLEAAASGEVVLVCQARDGVLRFLFQPSVEAGFRERVQLGPTLDRPVDGSARAGASAGGSDRLSDWLAESEPRTHVSCLHSDEGGRFWRSVSRYSIVEVAPWAPAPPSEGACWLSLGEVRALLPTPGTFSNEARSALSLALPWL